MISDHHRRLLSEGLRYKDHLGYTVGLAKDKKLIQHLEGPKHLPDPNTWNNISLVLEDIVCVDFDDCMSLDVGWDRELPPTLKERSPRGFHLFYRISYSSYIFPVYSRIKWKSNIDLLVRNADNKRSVKYADDDSQPPFGGHVIISPSNGYKRVYPDEVPRFEKLTPAPKWLMDELKDTSKKLKWNETFIT